MNYLINIIATIVSLPARIKGMKFGKRSFIGPGYDCLQVRLKGIELGSDVAIGRNAMFSAAKEIRIGKKCLFSYNVSILDPDHRFVKDKSPMDTGMTDGEAIVIEDDCFIGAHTFILKGVHIGKNSVVGANSVVTKSFPAHSIIVGNPAILIKTLG